MNSTGKELDHRLGALHTVVEKLADVDPDSLSSVAAVLAFRPELSRDERTAAVLIAARCANPDVALIWWDEVLRANRVLNATSPDRCSACDFDDANHSGPDDTAYGCDTCFQRFALDLDEALYALLLELCTAPVQSWERSFGRHLANLVASDHDALVWVASGIRKLVPVTV